MDASLGNRHRLLFHRLVDGDPIRLGHFIEFVHADNAPIGQDHRAGFETTFARVGIGGYGGSEADAGRALAGGGDGEGGDGERRS